MPGLEEQFMAIADAKLSSLVEPEAAVPAGVVVEQWQLPEEDRVALRAWGLPDGPMLRPVPQTEKQPVLTPNIAGDLERRLLRPEATLYRLGVYGSDFDPQLSIRVGAVAGTGQVMGIRGRPVTTADIHVQLQPYHPNLYHPAVCYFSQSVVAFLEVAWRWRAAVEVLRAYPEPPGCAPIEEHEWYQAEIERSCAMFLACMTQLDPTLGDGDLNSVWVGTITEDL